MLATLVLTFAACCPYTLSVQTSNPDSVTRYRLINFIVWGGRTLGMIWRENLRTGIILRQLLNRYRIRSAPKKEEKTYIPNSERYISRGRAWQCMGETSLFKPATNL